MPKVISWTEKEWQDQLKNRLISCKKHREPWDNQWMTNGSVVYNANSAQQSNSAFNVTFDNVIELESGDVDQGDAELGTNYTFKFIRHRLGQLSANPPSVMAVPTSPDLSDRRKADAADRVIRHGYQDQRVEEHFNRALQKALIRSIGWIKCVWDPERGDVYDFTEETKEIKMGGDIHIYSPSTFDIWVDPMAKTYDEARYVIERHFMSAEEAVFKWPHAKKILKNAVVSANGTQHTDRHSEDTVEIYEYYEKGSPMNGGIGLRAYTWHH